MAEDIAPPGTYDIGDENDLVRAAQQWLEARTARDEWDARMQHFARLLIDGVPEDAKKVTIARRPFGTIVRPGPAARFDRDKFDGDYPGLYEQYVVMGNARRPFIRAF